MNKMTEHQKAVEAIEDKISFIHNQILNLTAEMDIAATKRSKLYDKLATWEQKLSKATELDNPER